jgi:hypothetical protein
MVRGSDCNSPEDFKLEYLIEKIRVTVLSGVSAMIEKGPGKMSIYIISILLLI